MRQGRTDAWIAHQLDVSTAELREFRRRHELMPDGDTGDLELRDEIEAEIEALGAEEPEEEEPEEAEPADAEDEEPAGDEAGPSEEEAESARAAAASQPAAEPAAEAADAEAAEAEGEEREEAGTERPRRRRRRRRRGGGGRPGAALQATFDHGETDGYGLWLDPAVQDDPVYAEHWAGHREVEVAIEPERIVIRRA